MLKSVKSIKKPFINIRAFYYIYKCFYIVKMGAAGFVKIYVKRMAYIKYFNFVFLVWVAGALGFGFICRRSECFGRSPGVVSGLFFLVSQTVPG